MSFCNNYVRCTCNLTGNRLLLTGSTDNPSHRADNIEKSDPNTSSNAAYGIARRVEGAEEIVYTYPEMNFDSTIEAKQNEAYATNIITQGNEAYATTAAL